jgi:nucleoid-associated protein YgaU
MGRETKIGLGLILILLSAFGFVVYKKLKDKQAETEVTQQENPNGEGDNLSPVEGDPDLTELNTTLGQVQPAAHAPGIPDQTEPADPFSSDEGGQSPAFTPNVRNRSIPQSEPRQLADLNEMQDEPLSNQRPINTIAEIPDQPELGTELVDERPAPALSNELEITETAPTRPGNLRTVESLPQIESRPTVEQPLIVETPQPRPRTTQQEFPAKPINRAPAITLSPPEESVEPRSNLNDRFEGYGIATQRRDTAVVTADDERLEGFREVPIDGRRAFAQTRVEKPAAPVLASATSGASPTKSDLTPILPKRGAAAARQDDPFEAQPTERIVRKAAATPRIESDPATHNPTTDVYTVQPNDNYWSISRKQYGTARYFQALAKFNAQRVTDPTQMKPGLQIATPAREVLEQQFPELVDRTASRTASATAGQTAPANEGDSSGFFVDAAGQPLYRVGSEDTLTSISQRHLGRASRWTEIYEKNVDQLKSADALKIGTVLRLPPDASQVRVVQEPGARR